MMMWSLMSSGVGLTHQAPDQFYGFIRSHIRREHVNLAVTPSPALFETKCLLQKQNNIPQQQQQQKQNKKQQQQQQTNNNNNKQNKKRRRQAVNMNCCLRKSTSVRQAIWPRTYSNFSCFRFRSIDYWDSNCHNCRTKLSLSLCMWLYMTVTWHERGIRHPGNVFISSRYYKNFKATSGLKMCR